ncbi:hypothetical protein GCM10027161_72300 [Microbispora hainanensis]
MPPCPAEDRVRTVAAGLSVAVGLGVAAGLSGRGRVQRSRRRRNLPLTPPNSAMPLITITGADGSVSGLLCTS